MESRKSNFILNIHLAALSTKEFAAAAPFFPATLLIGCIKFRNRHTGTWFTISTNKCKILYIIYGGRSSHTGTFEFIKMQNANDRERLCSPFPQNDSSLVQFRDRLCVDYPGSGVPRAECSQEWQLWAGNHHARDRHWRTYGHLWSVYTIHMSYCGWASHHRTVLEVFCRYSRVLRLRSQETSSPHAVPCTHWLCCLPSWLTVSGLARDMCAAYQ